jgi:hypothetical protein
VRNALVVLAVAASLTLALLRTSAQEQKPEEKPRVLMCVPLGVLPGETVKVVARGFKLEGATEVRSAEPRVAVKLLSQGKTAVPGNQNPLHVGDNQVEFELVVPAELPAGPLELAFITPHGEAKYALPVAAEFPAITEQEPNPGFKQAQPLGLPQLVIGRIENPLDVDVYAVELAAGQRVVCEVIAERLGSGLDALLTAYHASGRTLVALDDLAESRDASIEFTATEAGRYYVVVQDAHDQGGPGHPYRFAVRLLP